MNTKVLIQTLTELPDLELLKQLEDNLKNTGSASIPNLNKLFDMFCSIFKCNQKKILFRGLLLLSYVAKTLLPTQLEISWRAVGAEVVRLCGEEDEEVRKKGKQTLFELLYMTKNSMLFLQTLSSKGLQNANTLVIASSIQLIQRIFEEHTHLLEQKSNVTIIKLILQKIIRFTLKDQQHSNIYKKAHQFMQALFYMNFSSLDEVLSRMDSSYIKILQKLWQKNKEQLLYKYKTQEEKVQHIQYEHLPMIRDKIFGVYEPFVIKQLFSSETKAAKQFAVQQFQGLFMDNEQKLTKFVNPITKIIITLLPDRHIEIVMLLAHILSIPGIANIVNLQNLLEILLPQLGDSSVPYRKQVRDCFQKLNGTGRGVIEFYNKKFNQMDRNNEQYDWILVFELLQLLFHWMSVSQSADCYPPALNDAIVFSFNKRKTKIPKVKEKCAQFLFFLLEKYPTYRQTLEEILSQQEMGELQDQIESRKNFLKLNQEHKKDAKETFIMEYQQERDRYLKEKKNMK